MENIFWKMVNIIQDNLKMVYLMEKEYCKIGKIKYEDNYINDKREGNGKGFWQDGEYFIEQLKMVYLTEKK